MFSSTRIIKDPRDIYAPKKYVVNTLKKYSRERNAGVVSVVSTNPTRKSWIISRIYLLLKRGRRHWISVCIHDRNEAIIATKQQPRLAGPAHGVML